MKMKENGVREDDPEYLKAHNLLTAVSQQQQFRKRQAQQQEAIARQQRQIQQQQNPAIAQNIANGANGTNGVNGKSGHMIGMDSTEQSHSRPNHIRSCIG